MNMRKTLLRYCCFVVLTSFSISTAFGQGHLGQGFEVNDSVESIQMIAGSSKRLTFPYDVPELMVENPEVISASPVSSNEINIAGLKPGISSLTISDPDSNLQTIIIEVGVDVRPLERAFAAHFPESKITVAPLQNSVILKGYVARADQMQNIVAVARDYFPTNVINHLQVNGSQNIAMKVKVYEVSRTKLRQLGIDWSVIGSDAGFVSSVAGLIESFSLTSGEVTGVAGESNINFGVTDGSTAFNAFIQFLEQRNVAKLLDEPTLVAQNGRPAEFLSGGEVPILIANGLQGNTIEFRPFGTKLDLVPIVHGQGQLTLEIRAEVSEVAPELSGGTGTPGFRVRRVNTGVKMKVGHTLALAGDYRQDTASEQVGVPRLMDHPFWGNAFRRTEEEVIETELVFLITPRLISEVEPNQVSDVPIGQVAGSPSDHELFVNGHIEVPRCQDDCPVDDAFDTKNGFHQHQAPANLPPQGQPGGQFVPPPASGSGTTNGSFSRNNAPVASPKTSFAQKLSNWGSKFAPKSNQQRQASGALNWPSQR